MLIIVSKEKKGLKPKAVSDLLKREEERLSQTESERQAIIDALISCAPKSFSLLFELNRHIVEELVKSGNAITYVGPGDFPYRRSRPRTLQEVEQRLDSLKRAWEGVVNIKKTRKEVYIEVSFEAI